jgi:hypothetical protein
MKPKSARRKLTRMHAGIGQVIKDEGIRKASKKIKPYMNVLKKDLKNPASARVYNRFRTIFFG